MFAASIVKSVLLNRLATHFMDDFMNLGYYKSVSLGHSLYGCITIARLQPVANFRVMWHQICL